MASNIKETLEVNIKLNQSSFKEIESIAANITNSFSNAGILIQNNMSTALSNVSNSMGMLGDTTQASSDDIINNIKSISSNIETLDLTIKKTSDGNNFGGLQSSINETSDTIIQKFDGAYGAISDVIATASKFKPFEEAIKKNEAAIIAFSVAIKSAKAIVEIVNLFKSVSSVATTLASAQQVATVSTTILTGAVSALKIMMGGLVVGAIAALVIGFKSYCDSLDNSTNMNKRHKKELQEMTKAMEEQSEQSDESLRKRMSEIEISKTYSNRILDLIDENGNLKGSKESLKGAIDSFNDSMGETVYWYDEETGKIMNQSGEVQNLKKSFEDLFAIKRGNAYLDSHLEQFEDNGKRIKDLTSQNLEAARKYKEVSDNFSSDLGIDFEPVYQSFKELREARENDLISQQFYDNEIKKFKDNKLYDKLLQLDQVVLGMDKTAKEVEAIKYFNEEYLALQKAVSEGDLSKINDFFLDLNITGQTQSVETLLEAIKLAEQELKDGEILKKLGFDFDDDELNERLGKLREKFKELTGVDPETYEEQLKLQKDVYLNPSEEAVNEVIDRTISKRVQDNTDASKKMFEDLAEDIKIFNENAPRAYIPVEYVAINTPDNPSPPNDGFHNGWYSGIKSSFDDSQQQNEDVIQPFSTGSMVGASRKIIGSLQRRVISTIKVGIPRPNLILDNAGSTAITQNVSFNQPIQKPSDVTRAMQKASRNLRKVK